MKEGTHSKGGRNSSPKTARPATPPPAQPPAAPVILPIAHAHHLIDPLDSVKKCVKCDRDFDRGVSEPKLEYCEKEDVVIMGQAFRGEHIHRTCLFCSFRWIERIRSSFK